MGNLSSTEIDQLRHNARLVVRELGLLNDAYFEIGVTLAERHLLIELASCTRPNFGEIAERLLLDKSTVSRLIAKALKKGYIACSWDKKDRRKRFLELTELGKKTLDAFEPIAFSQTKNALLTLTPQEVDQVYQGVSLYAKGLKSSRLNEKVEKKSNAQVKIENFQEVTRQLEQLGFVLKPFCKEDESALYGIFREVVDSGGQFPYECSSSEEFYHKFLNFLPHVYVCRSKKNEVVGGFYIRPNFSGRAQHIANAAYMVRADYRGKGVGALLVKASLHLAKELGFHAMQFNMVLGQNTIAVKLYKKLGFDTVGTIPVAIRNPDGSYQDGYIMHCKLDNL